MDMQRAARILNMELLGLSSEDFLDEDDFREATGRMRDLPPCTADYDHSADLPANWPTDDEATGQEYTLTIRFDTDTLLEAQLVASALLAFADRRTSARNIHGQLTD